jgi:outer membrane protein assembly factor BamD
MVDSYPLYSQADDALMMLGRAYDSEATIIKNSKIAETAKGKLVQEYQQNAATAYDRIIQRYPLSDRVAEARNRLTELQKPIPTPTPEAIAQYKAEEASRSEVSRTQRVMSTFHKGPEDVVRASKVGDPTLVDPQQTSAAQLIRAANSTALGINDPGNGTVTVDKGSGATPGANDPVPRSDAGSAPPPTTPANPDTATAGNGNTAAASSNAAAPASASSGSDTGIGELTPNAAAPAANGAAPANPADANGTATPQTGTAAPTADAQPQMPAQVNEIQNGAASTDKATAASSSSSSATDTGSSSSKKKKKKGLKKIVPF